MVCWGYYATSYYFLFSPDIRKFCFFVEAISAETPNFWWNIYLYTPYKINPTRTKHFVLTHIVRDACKNSGSLTYLKKPRGEKTRFSKLKYHKKNVTSRLRYRYNKSKKTIIGYHQSNLRQLVDLREKYRGDRSSRPIEAICVRKQIMLWKYFLYWAFSVENMGLIEHR